MITNNDIVRFLESLRISKNIQIAKMTSGVMTPRNYNRLINNELDINVSNLLAMLENIGVPFEDFIMYVNSKERLEDIDVEYFITSVLFENYNRASEYYERVRNAYDDFSSNILSTHRILKRKDFQVMKVYLDYYNNKISFDACKTVIAGILKLNEVVRNYFVYSDDIMSLIVYLRLCDDNELNQIAHHIIDGINKNSFVIIGRKNALMNYLLYYIILYALTKRKKINKEEINMIKEYSLKVLDFHDKIMISPYNVMMCELLYKYIKNNNIINKQLIFDYISGVLSCSNELFMENKKFDIFEEDIDIYYELIDNDKFIKARLAKRSSYV